MFEIYCVHPTFYCMYVRKLLKQTFNVFDDLQHTDGWRDFIFKYMDLFKKFPKKNSLTLIALAPDQIV